MGASDGRQDTVIKSRAAWPVFAVVMVVPWLALLLPRSSLLGDTAAATCIALSALAGLGSLAAFALRRPRSGLVDVWALGLGSYIVLAGALTAAHQFTLSVQLALLISGMALQSIAMIVLRVRVLRAITGVLGRARGLEIAIATLVIAITCIHVVGLGSSHFAPAFFDDDGNWLVAVKRLRDTGGFSDIIGYPRAHHLGGSVIATGLVATLDEVRCSRLAEGLGFLLTIAALYRIAFTSSAGPVASTRRAQGYFVFLLLVLGLSAKAQAETELWAFWIPAFLVVSSYRVLAAPGAWSGRRAFELGILIGALCTFRFEYVPFAITLVIVTLRDEQGTLMRGRLIGGVAGLLCAVLPLAIDRFAERGLATSVPRLVWSLLPVVALLALAAWRDVRGSRRSLYRLGWAAAIGVALMYVGPALAKGYSPRLAWTLIYSFVFVLTAELARAQWTSRQLMADPALAAFRFRHYATAIVTMICLVSLMRAQDETVRANWHNRFKKWLTSARLSNAVGQIAGAEPYAKLLAEAPAGAAVLSWVDRPELIDYSTHEIYDLRVPRLAKNLRKFSWAPTGSPLLSYRASTGARYLLLQSDRLRDKRSRDSNFYSLWCWGGRPDSVNSPYAHRPVECADALEQELLNHRVVRAIDNVYLIDLDQPAATAKL
ncbi:MAG: hypothetical protein H0T42_17110 [Deltaproteobacteria bacterium]|nr:hypothetical protein [Deltaproteobacteria bacterium]